MKEKRNVGDILRGADENTAVRIAELCPPVDEETRSRLFARTQERLQDPEYVQQETFHVTTVHRPLWKTAAAAAACLVIAGSAAGGAFLMQRSRISRPDLSQEQLAASDAVQSDTEPAGQETTQVRMERTEQAEQTICGIFATEESLKSTEMEETTAATTKARCLDQTNLVTVLMEESANTVPETQTSKQTMTTPKQTMTTPVQTMTVPVQTEGTTVSSTGKQTETVKTTETTTTTTTEVSDLTEEQLRQLEELRAEGDRLFGWFVRQEMIITGELPADAPRLTLMQMEEIIGGSADFAQILQALRDAQFYPDFVGGSGVTNIWYWLDDAGTEQILITLQQEEVAYVHPDENGTGKTYEKLY